MVAAAMLGGLMVGTLFAIASWLLERALLRAKRPVRWVWLAGMLGTTVVFAWSMVPAPLHAPIFESTQTNGAMLAPAGLRDGLLDARPSGAVVSSSTHTVAGGLPIGRWSELRSAAIALDRPLLMLWGVGSVVLATWLLVGTVGTQRTARASALPLTRPVGAAMQGDDVILTRNMGPAAIGIWRQHILLPRWVLSLDRPLLELILLHERQHVNAKDPLLLLIATLMVVVMPWQVPLWFMIRRLRRAIEFDCDARVLHQQPQVQRYASLLLMVGNRRETGHAAHGLLAPFVFLSTGSARSALRQRILVMTQQAQPAHGIRSSLSVLCVISLVCAAAGFPIPRGWLVAQAPAAGAAASVSGEARDKPVYVRYVIGGVTYVDKNWKKSVMHTVERATPFSDPNAGFTTINVTSTSGKPTDVRVFFARAAGDRESRSDTSVIRTPFALVQRSEVPAVHLESVGGDSLIVTSPAAVAPAFASKARGTHVLVFGLNRLGIVQR